MDNVTYVCWYLNFIVSIDDHKQLVFVDKNPMKDINIFRNVMHNILNSDTPNHRMNANNKNRYNISVAVTIKRRLAKKFDWVVLEIGTDDPRFLIFERTMLRNGTLARGLHVYYRYLYKYIEDNNIGIQEKKSKRMGY